MEHKSGCLVCGAGLAYFEAARPLACWHCQETSYANVSCVHGHFVCDRCHGSSANDLIERYCTQTTETDPVAIATALMQSPLLKMHGPEHHFLIPAALLAAYYNQGATGCRAGNAPAITEKARLLAEARRRAEQVPGGACGFWGACGAAVGAGIFLSLITQATPLSVKAWRLSNGVTAGALKVIAEHGGPRCCKRGTF